jgi:hypothetical protein
MDEISVTRGARSEAHHAVPRCLIELHERATTLTELDGEGIEAWLEWEWEAMRWRVPVEISREDLEALVASSEVVMAREAHRVLHGTDWQRWGARGGRETLRRYGRPWFALLARRRWGRVGPGELESALATMRVALVEDEAGAA